STRHGTLGPGDVDRCCEAPGSRDTMRGGTSHPLGTAGRRAPSHQQEQVLPSNQAKRGQLAEPSVSYAAPSRVIVKASSAPQVEFAAIRLKLRELAHAVQSLLVEVEPDVSPFRNSVRAAGLRCPMVASPRPSLPAAGPMSSWD